MFIVKITIPSFSGTILLCMSLLFSFFTYGQEICNNGVDDDGDGFIDLNDTADCHCAQPTTEVPSLIPNPSFETMACCPSGYSQLNCAQSWIQASDATSDYMNTCGMVFPAATAAGLVPFPDGNGIAGLISSIGWQEYIGACLLSPMLADSSYSLQMNIASTPITGNAGVCNGGIISYSPSDIVLYGSVNCSDLPFSGYACPPSNWQVLGTINYIPVSSWGTITITFTPTVNINAIIFGSPCTLPSDYTGSPCYPYFYFDNLLLNKTSAFSSMITQTGNWCSNTTQLIGNAVSGATYQWYLNGVALVGQTGLTLNVSGNNLPIGIYTLVTLVGSDCSRASASVVKINNPPAIFPAGPFCKYEPSVILNANIAGGTWGGTGITDPTVGVFDPAMAIIGNNSIYYTLPGSGNCPGIDTITIVVNDSPVANAGGDITICSGVTGNIGGSPIAGYLYSWTPSTGLSSSIASNPTITTVNNGTTPLITNYSLITTDAATGCQSLAQIVVTVNPQPIITPVGPFCKNDPALNLSVNLTGGVWGGSGISSASIGTFDPAIAVVGNNSVVYTATGTCSDVDSITIVINALPISNAGADISLCTGDAGNIGSTAILGNTYAWNPITDLTTSTDANPSITMINTGISPITTTYIVTTTSSGCVSTDTVNVTVNPLATADAGPAQTICSSSDVILTGIVGASATNGTWTGGNGVYNPDNITLNTVYTPSLAEINAGSVSLTLVSDDPPGSCPAATSTINITIDLMATVNAGLDDTICNGSTITLAGAFAGGATGGTWSGGGGLYNPNNTTANAVYTPSFAETETGFASLTYTTDDPSGPCPSVSDSILITIMQPPSANAGSAQYGCAGATFTLAGSIGGSASSGIWSGGSGTFSPGNTTLNAVYTPSTAEALGDSVLLTLTTDNLIGTPCTASASSVSLYFYKNPVINFTVNDAEGCPVHCVNFSDFSVVIGEASVASWSWNFGDNSPASSEQNPSHCYSLTGLYDVSLTAVSSNNCSGSHTIQQMIQVFSMPMAEFEPTPNPATVLSPSVTMNNQSSSDVNYWFWSFGDGDTLTMSTPNAIHLFPNDSTGIYQTTLIVQNASGCADTIIHEIVIGPEFSFFIPNAFTPNNDGTNDYFRGEGIGILKYELMIFDRWGNMIFYSDDLNKAWDGKANNGTQVSQQDIYVWKVKLTDVFKKKYDYIGTVTILR